MPGTGYGQLSVYGEVTGHGDTSSKVILLLNGYVWSHRLVLLLTLVKLLLAVGNGLDRDS